MTPSPVQPSPPAACAPVPPAQQAPSNVYQLRPEFPFDRQQVQQRCLRNAARRFRQRQDLLQWRRNFLNFGLTACRFRHSDRNIALRFRQRRALRCRRGNFLNCGSIDSDRRLRIIRKSTRRFRRGSGFRICGGNLLNFALVLDFHGIAVVPRRRRDDPNVRHLLPRLPELLRVALADVNRLAPAILPAGDNPGSKVAIEAVMRRKWLRWFSRLETPLRPACAVSFRHTPIVADHARHSPRAVTFRDGTCNPVRGRTNPKLASRILLPRCSRWKTK